MATSVSEALNMPVPILIGDRICKLRRLNIATVYGQLEQEVLEEYVTRMRDIAKDLTGSDKVDYLVQMSQAMPSGSVLAGMASQRIGSMSGLMRLFAMSLVPEAGKDGQPLPMPDLIPLLSENKDLIRQLTKAIVGIEVKAVKPEASAGGPLSQAPQK